MMQHFKNFGPHGNKVCSLWVACDNLSSKTVYGRLTEFETFLYFEYLLLLPYWYARQSHMMEPLYSSDFVYVLWTTESLGCSGVSWFNVCVCCPRRECFVVFCTLRNKYK
jgi:hypothetical protein